MSRPTDDNGYYIYDKDSITTLKSRSEWRGCLSCPERSSSNQYVIVATGNASLDGREYVSLPKETDLSDPKIKAKYNLM